MKKRLDQGRARPTPNIDTTDLELLVAWKYLGYDPPFHTRRTLDQFGYPNLSDTRPRDDDQMLYKMTKNFPRGREDVVASNVKPRGNERERECPKPANGDENKPDFNKDSSLNLKDGKVLMVDQVWLWIVDNGMNITVLIFSQLLTCCLLKGTLMTFFPQVRIQIVTHSQS